MVLVVVALVAVAIAVGVLRATGDGDEPAAAPPAPETTAPPGLADVDTETLAVARDRFCDDVPDEAVVAALGGEPIDTTSYDNGQRARLTGEVRDVAHEFHCEWRGAGGERAAAWVFAPPVTPEQATRLARQARRAERCDVLPDAAAFGSPSVATRCQTLQGGRVGYVGLFGSAWLSCTLTASRGAGERADQWCAAVALAASSG